LHRLRDPILIREFLETDGPRSEERFSTFRAYNLAVTEKELFEQLVEQFEPGFLGDAAGTLLERERASVVVSDRSRADSFIRLVYSVLPVDHLQRLSVVSDCASPDRDDTEDVVLTEREEATSSRFGGFRRGTADGTIDLFQEIASNNQYSACLTDIYAELAADEGWFDIDWNEKHAILTDFLARRYAGDDCDIIDSSDKLSAMQRTIERARNIGTQSSSNGWF
jgi:hypothetical protein